MIESLTKSIPMIIGLILSPLPLIAMFMLLLTPGAKRNSFAFLVGWFVGIFSIGLLVLYLPYSVESTWKSLGTSKDTQITLGVLMLISIVFVIYKGRKRTDPIKIPKLLRQIDKLGYKRSLILGLLMCTVNVKNLALVTAGAIQIKAMVNLQNIESSFSLFIFSLLSSLSMIIPVLIYNFSQEKMDALFLNSRNFLIRNQSYILIVVLAFFGILFISMGLSSV